MSTTLERSLESVEVVPVPLSPAARLVQLGLQFRRHGPGVVIGNASSLVVTSLVTSALGVVFWWLAAQHFVPASVGLAAATVSASQLLGSFCVLGFGTFLISELPTATPARRTALVSTAVCISGLLGAVSGVVFALIAPFLMGDLRPLQGDLTLAVFFALAVSSTAVGLILDQVATGSLQSRYQLWRNTACAVIKLVLLVPAIAWLPGNPALFIFATWPVGNVLSIVLIVRLLATSPRAHVTLGRPHLNLVRPLGSAGISHHALNMSLQFPSMVLPVIVTALLSATSNAFFYTAWMAAGVAFLPQSALAVTLFAVGVHERAHLAHRTRLTLGLGLLAGFGAAASLYLVGNLVLGLFGHAYAEESSICLRILVLAVVPLMIKNHCMVLFRIERRVLVGAVAAAVGAGVEVLGAAVGAQYGGLTGLCVGWLIMLTCEGAVMLPTVLRSAALLPVQWRAPLQSA